MTHSRKSLAWHNNGRRVRNGCVLLLGLLLGLSACADPEAPEAAIDGDNSDATAASVAPVDDNEQLPAAYDLLQARQGDLDRMIEERVIRVLTVYSVGRYYVDDGQEKGLVRERIRDFEKFINQRFSQGRSSIHVTLIPVARNQLIPALLAGRGDIIDASLSITPERQQLVDFSIPVSKPLAEILITGPAATALESIDDLAGKTVYLRQSSSYQQSVEDLNRRFLQEQKEPVIIEAVSEVLEDDDLVEMVNAGLLPWAIADDYKMAWWESVFTELTPREDIVLRSGSRTAWAFRPQSPQLEKAVNDFLRTHREGTLLGNVLKNRYIRDFDWASNALAQHSYERLIALESTFRKYGQQYDIEPLLLAAQGYQESRLDQSARSSAGAIGIMQIKRATAADHNVNIKGIDQVDGNIHAGAKYLDFLRRRYFSDPGIDSLNSTLLALAAYNVGPSRMINLRRQAGKMGYDPNLWFDNVELAAAKSVGREPVHYVSNIYKYYLSYLLTETQLEQRVEARERAGIEAGDIQAAD